MNETLKEIRALEDKYGFVLFRMALTHLVDVGVRHLTNEYVEESIQKILSDSEKDSANGIGQIMTTEFLSGIVRCAAELSVYKIWDIFAYIKKHIVIEDL